MSELDQLKSNVEGLLAVDRPDQALESISNGLSFAPNDPDLLYFNVRALLALGHGSDALIAAERLVAVAPNDPRSHLIFALAVCQRWQMSPRKIRKLALPAARGAVELGPQLSETHFIHAYVLTKSVWPLLLHRSTLAQSRVAAQEATRLAPNWVPPLLLLCDIERLAGRRDLSAEYAESALRLDPTDSDTLLSAFISSRGSRRRLFATRFAAVHPSQTATYLVLRTHKPLPLLVRLVAYIVVGLSLTVSDALNHGEVLPGPEYLWVIGPFTGLWLGTLGLGWRRRTLTDFDQAVRDVIFDWERRYRWLRRATYTWLAVLPALWIPASLMGSFPSAWALAWVFTGVITALMIRPRYGM